MHACVTFIDYASAAETLIDVYQKIVLRTEQSVYEVSDALQVYWWMKSASMTHAGKPCWCSVPKLLHCVQNAMQLFTCKHAKVK